MALYQAKHAGRSCIRIVLGGLDGTPVGTDSATKPTDGATKPTAAANATLPFPDRRNPNRSDRRKVPGPGRRRTDAPVVQDRQASGGGRQ
jgi:hypothetical protein